MGKTSIEWTDESINPIRAAFTVPGGGGRQRVGHYCEKISPGCRECYASRLQSRFGLPVFQDQRAVPERIEPFLDTSKLDEVLGRKKPTRFFWEDMSDLFGAWVETAWIIEAFAVMLVTPWHTHQILTKRADRMVALLLSDDFRQAVEQRREILAMGSSRLTMPAPVWPPANIWVGFSGEDQATFDARWQHVRRLADAGWTTWASLEPLLGPVDIREALPREVETGQTTSAFVKGLRWAVVGGESHPSKYKARICRLDWIRAIVKAAYDGGLALFVKQLGARPIGTEGVDFWRDTVDHVQNGIPRFDGPAVTADGMLCLTHPKGGDWSEWAGWGEAFRVRQFPTDPF